MVELIEQILSQENWTRKQNGPLYVQLHDQIENAIQAGDIKPGEPLPSERLMAEMSNVSRITVRKAVQALVNDGLIVQRQGSGTSVAPKVQRVQQSLSRLTSFSEDMSRRGSTVQSNWLEKGLFDPSPRETVALGLSTNSQVARISRLRIADGVPLAIERASLSPQFLPDPENVGRSLYSYLEKLGCKPARAIQRISASNINMADAELLVVEEGFAGLNIERTSYLPTGQVVEFTRSIYRGDAYDFVAELEIGDDVKSGDE